VGHKKLANGKGINLLHTVYLFSGSSSVMTS